jgi:hypothetical protein
MVRVELGPRGHVLVEPAGVLLRAATCLHGIGRAEIFGDPGVEQEVRELLAITRVERTAGGQLRGAGLW